VSAGAPAVDGDVQCIESEPDVAAYIGAQALFGGENSIAAAMFPRGWSVNREKTLPSQLAQVSILRAELLRPRSPTETGCQVEQFVD
jgi:hypothetical protein